MIRLYTLLELFETKHSQL